MRFFKKRIKQKLLGASLAEKIAVWVLHRQRKWADYLNERTKHASARSKLIVLILFCLVFGAYLIGLLITSIL